MLKVIITTISFFSIQVFYCQQINSFFFNSPQPSGQESVNFFDVSVRGTYQKEDDKFVDIIIDSTVIYSRYFIKMYLTLNELETNEKYYTKDSLLYGIVENEGLKYMSFRDTLHFLVLQKDTFFYPKSETSALKKMDDKYYLNYKEVDVWNTIQLYVKMDNLYIRLVDYPEEYDKINACFKNLSEKEINNQEAIVSENTREELKCFVQQKGFYDITTYKKIY